MYADCRSAESDQKSHDSLEVGEDDQTDDQGHNGQAMTHHSQVVETDGKLHGQTNWFTHQKCKFIQHSLRMVIF